MRVIINTVIIFLACLWGNFSLAGEVLMENGSRCNTKLPYEASTTKWTGKCIDGKISGIGYIYSKSGGIPFLRLFENERPIAIWRNTSTNMIPPYAEVPGDWFADFTKPHSNLSEIYIKVDRQPEWVNSIFSSNGEWNQIKSRDSQEVIRQFKAGKSPSEIMLAVTSLSKKSSAETTHSDSTKNANSVTDAWVAVYTIEGSRGNDARAIYTRADSKDKALENFREHFSQNTPWLHNIKYDLIKCEPGWGANFNFRVDRDDYGANEADGISCGAIDPQSAIKTAYAECKKRDSRCGQPGANFGQNVQIAITTFKVGGRPENVNNKKTNADDASIISEESDYFLFVSYNKENYIHSRNSDYSLSESDSRNIFQYMKNLGFPVR